MEEELLPSEVARLILGFLKENKCEKSWNTFLEECSDLYEYNLLYKRGKLYSTNVNGKSLADILKEYCVLKNTLEKSSSIAKFCESVCKEKCKIILLESVRNAVEQVIQKYLPCFCRNSPHKCDLLTDVTQIDHICDHNSDKTIELEGETEKMDQSNTDIHEENASKGNPDCYENSAWLKSTDCDSNSLTEELISENPSKLDNLDHNFQSVEHSASDRMYMHDIIKVEKDTENLAFLEHNSRNNGSKNEKINSHSSSTNSESIMSLHSTENNSVAIESIDKVVSTVNNQQDNTVKSCELMQTNYCSPKEIEQTIKVESDSCVNSIDQTDGSNHTQNDSTVTRIVDNHNSNAETNNPTFCTISTRGSVNMANPINMINSQPGIAVHPFASQSLPVSNMSYPSLQTYFVENCPSNSTFLQNNSQYRIIINTPVTGSTTTFPLTIPSILPSNIGPTLASVTSLSSQNPPSFTSLSSQNPPSFTSLSSQNQPSFTSLSSQNPRSVSSVTNSSSFNINAATAAADSTNTCDKPETDSTSVLDSVCKAAETLVVAPTKIGRNAASKSGQKGNSSKKSDLKNPKQSKRKSKFENLAALRKK